MDIKATATIESTTQLHQLTQRQNVTIPQQQKDHDLVQQFKNLSKEQQQKVLEEKSKEINDKFAAMNTQLKIEIDKETNERVVKIVDTKKNEVIRQIPPETLLKIAKYIDELTGILFKDKA